MSQQPARHSLGGSQGQRSAATEQTVAGAYATAAASFSEEGAPTYGGTNQNLAYCQKFYDPDNIPFAWWFDDSFSPVVLAGREAALERPLKPSEVLNLLFQYLDNTNERIKTVTVKVNDAGVAKLEELKAAASAPPRLASLVTELDPEPDEGSTSELSSSARRPATTQELSDEAVARLFKQMIAWKLQYLKEELTAITPIETMTAMYNQMKRNGITDDPRLFTRRFKAIARAVNYRWASMNELLFMKLTAPWLKTRNLGPRRYERALENTEDLRSSETDKMDAIAAFVADVESKTYTAELKYRDMAAHTSIFSDEPLVDPLQLSIGMGLYDTQAPEQPKPTAKQQARDSNNSAPAKGNRSAEITVNGQVGVYSNKLQLFLPRCPTCSKAGAKLGRYHTPEYCPKKKSATATSGAAHAAGSIKTAGASNAPRAPRPPLECWNCKGPHGFTECPEPLSVALQQRLKTNARDNERRQKYLTANGLTGKQAHVQGGSATFTQAAIDAAVARVMQAQSQHSQQQADSSPSLEAMIQTAVSKLQTSSQQTPAPQAGTAFVPSSTSGARGSPHGANSHGGTTAYAASTSVPWHASLPPFSDDGYDDGLGRCGHMQGYDNQLYSAPLATAMQPLATALYGVKGMRWSKTVAREEREAHTRNAHATSPAAPTSPAPPVVLPSPVGTDGPTLGPQSPQPSVAADQPVNQPTARRRVGRPRVLPRGTSEDPGLRMEHPGWDQQRADLAHRPLGYEPAPAEADPTPTSHGPAPDQRDHTRDSLQLRSDQLYHHLKAALQNCRFRNLDVRLVLESDEQTRQRWLQARDQALCGIMDTRDPFSVAWDTALRGSSQHFFAAAHIQLPDFYYHDMAALYRRAVRAVFGVRLPDAVLPVSVELPTPAQQPPAVQLHATQPLCEEAPASSTLTSSTSKPGDLSRALQANRPQVLHRTILPVDARRTLAPDSKELQTLRSAWRAFQGSASVYHRPGCSFVDLNHTTFHVCGVPVTSLLLDGGADQMGISRRVFDRLPEESKQDILQYVMHGIGGSTTCQQLVGPRLSVTLNLHTDWERHFDSWPRLVVFDQLELPDVILDTACMKAMDIGQLFGETMAFYPLRPHGSEYGYIPLLDAGMTVLARATSAPQTATPPPAPVQSSALLSEDWGGKPAVPPSPAGPAGPFLSSSSVGMICVFRDQSLSADSFHQSGTTANVQRQLIPSWQQQRAAKGNRIRDLYSHFDTDRLQAVGALPHTARDKLFIADLDKYSGKAGGQNELHICAGMLTVAMQRVRDGIHIGQIKVIESNASRRADILKQCEWIHNMWPDCFPRHSFSDIFSLSEELDHDAANLTAPLMLKHCGALDFIAVEFPCTDTSRLGYQLGLQGNRSGIIVPIAEALVDLQYLMAQQRGYQDWHSAPAQFGYQVENVDFTPTHDCSPEVEQAYEWMNRVFGSPNKDKNHEHGDASARVALWWTNMFTQTYYQAMIEEFRRPCVQTFAQIVHEMSGGSLSAQTATPDRPHTMMRGMNVAGEPMRLAPKWVSRPDTVSQVISPDTGQPGAGMVQVVGSVPPMYIPCPSDIRERCLNAPSGFYTRPELGHSETETVSIIGNVCAPTSVSVMNRLQVAYAHQREFETWCQTQSLDTDTSDAAQQTAVRSLKSAVRESVIAQTDYARKLQQVTTAVKHQFTNQCGHQPKDTHGARLTKAGRRWLDERKKATRDAERRAAKARERVATKLHEAKFEHAVPAVTQKQPRRYNHANSVMNALLWMSIVMTTCVTAYGLGSNAGLALMASSWVMDNQLLPRFPRPSPSITDAALLRCYVEFGNPPYCGKPEPTVKVPSQLFDKKEGVQHHWDISASFQRATELATVMDEHPDTYAWGLADLRPVNFPPYEFELTDENPVFRRQYHLAHREQEFADTWVGELEKAGLVKEVNSPYAAPVVVAPKKGETGAWDSLRYAIDYRMLNSKTVRDMYPCPTAEEILAKMEGATRFSSLDAQKAFHQLPVSDRCQRYIAFHAGNRLMTWTRMPFGQMNSVAAWQRVMDHALRGIPYAAAYAYDIVVWSGDSETEHMERLRAVLAALRKVGIQVAPKKCHLGMRAIEFLGHIVSGQGIEPMFSKVDAINNLPPPKSVSDVRAFLGMATYYCRFLKDFHQYKQPLTALLKKDVKWTSSTWGAAQQDAFDSIKQLLVSARVMRNPDWSRQFILHTDWSKAGVGATLSQVDDDGVEYAIAYASRTNNSAESSFSSYEGEVSAVHYAVQRFRYYLWGRRWKLVTDCRAMQWLRTTAKLRSKLARWSLLLAEYDFEIVHRAGKENVVPDMLSRHPTETARAPEDTDGSISKSSCSSYLASRPSPRSDHMQWAAAQATMAFIAGAMDTVMLTEGESRDIFEAPLALQFVRGELQRTDVSAEDWIRLQSRWRRYSYAQGKVWRTVGKRGALKLEVPPPAERADIIRRVHHKIGHLGRDRTYHMVSRYYWWPGMHAQTAAVLKQCLQCDRARASFSVKHDRLKPMPLFGMFYRFSVDSAGPFRTTVTGSTYVIVIVEHFSKWIELVSVPTLDPRQTTRAFQERVLARYGAPVEVVTDNGQEYQGQFASMLHQHGIDQVEIPAGHPSTNGMAERIVRVLKEALKKFVSSQGSLHWDSWLPVIEFGYRVTKQASTGYSPFFLMYGRDHVAPAQVRAMMDSPVDFEDASAVLDLISQRADILRSAMPQAFERALDAQRRDAVRFRKVRRGDVQPRAHRFSVNEYVYMSQNPLNSLDVSTTRTILQIKDISPSGWLELEGSDGKRISVHMDNCAPCHLSNLVPARRGGYRSGHRPQCVKCLSDSQSEPLVVCDKCDHHWHISCAGAPVLLQPGEEWLCPRCSPPQALPSA